MLLLVIGVLTLGVTNICLANQANQAEISETLNYLRTKVDTLDTKLDILLRQSEGQDNDASPERGDDQEDDNTITKPGQLLSAQRIPLDDGEKNRFIIRLRNTTNGKIFSRLFGDGNERAPDSIIAEGDEIYAINVDVPSNDIDTYYLQILDSEHDYAFYLNLKNTPYSAMTQSLENENIPVLSVHPERELVYTPGQNVNLNATLSFDEVSPGVSPSLMTSFSGIDLSSGDDQFMWSRFGLFDEYVHPRTPSKIESTYYLATDTHALGGFMFIFSYNNTIENTVVTSLQVNRAVTLRPSNQTGPFPVGYLQVVSENHYSRSSRGNELRTCRFGKECWIDCYAVGEHVSDIMVMKVLPDGGMGEVPSARSPAPMESTIQSVHWRFEADTEAMGGDGITTFMCTAHNEYTGQIATKLTEVQVTLKRTIDVEQSSVVIDTDLINHNLKKVTLNCAITGNPLPEVYFYAAHDPASIPVAEAPDHVIQANPYVAVAQKLFETSDQEISELRQAIASGNSTAYSCQFLTYETSEDIVASYTFPFL